MDTDSDDITEIMSKDVETMRDDKDKRSKDSLPLIPKKAKPKILGQDEAGIFLLMKKAHALGFSFEERQKLFLLYEGHL